MGLHCKVFGDTGCDADPVTRLSRPVALINYLFFLFLVCSQQQTRVQGQRPQPLRWYGIELCTTYHPGKKQSES